MWQKRDSRNNKNMPDSIEEGPAMRASKLTKRHPGAKKFCGREKSNIYYVIIKLKVKLLSHLFLLLSSFKHKVCSLQA